MKVPFLSYLLIFTIISSSECYAQELLKNFRDVNNPGGTIDNIKDGIEVNGQYFFRANGYELWKTDLTPSGTIKIGNVDIYNTGKFYKLGSLLIFLAWTNNNGVELWRSDGTDAGTFMLKDIRLGSLSSQISFGTDTPPVYLGNNLLFIADDGTHGSELWKTDGTADGTKMVKDINPTNNAGSGSVFGFQDVSVVYNSKLYFKAYDGTSSKLYVTDGNDVGTQIYRSTDFSKLYFYMGEFYIFNENVNLRAIGLYRITPNNYIFISAKHPEFYTDKILSFVPNTQNPNYTNLYRLNENVIDTFLKTFTSSINYERYYINGKVIFFTPGISTNPSSGYTIWASDGTDVGTVKIKEHFYSNGGESTRPWGTTQNILKLGNKVYYVNFNDPNNMETWVTDGTASGTILLKNFQIRDINVVNNKNYILENGNIWESDGTSNGTIQKTNFKTNFPDDYTPYLCVQIGNYLLISSPFALYKYNTTPPCLLNTSISSGNWNTTTTWSCGHIPIATEPVQISAGHTITLDVNGTAKSLDLRGILKPQTNKGLTIQGN